MLVSCFSCGRSCLGLCARSWSSLPAGFSTCTAGRPSWSAGPWSIVHEPGRPSCGRCARVVCCGVLRCAAVCCGARVVCPDAHEPVGARAKRRGLVLCGRARPGACRVLPCVATWPRTAGVVCKSMGMPAPARGRQRPRTSPREPVHERRPAQLGRRRMRAPGQRVTPGSLQCRPAGRPAGRPSYARAHRGP
jgi:hypothetical protein